MIDPAQLKMPSVSSECMAVMRLLDADEVDMTQLVRAITIDPVLSGTLLKYANSPLHRRAREATSVQQAVMVLGTRQVRAAVMVATMRGFASSRDRIGTLLWEQALALSTLARTVARRAAPRLADEAELAGLLHNMGALVLNASFPDLYRSLAEHLLAHGGRVHEAEREVFGLHRGDLIEPLAERFRLPARIVQVLLGYHAQQVPDDIIGDDQRLLALLWIARYAAQRSPAATNWLPEFVPDDVTALAEQLALTPEDLLDFSDDVEVLLAEHLAG